MRTIEFRGYAKENLAGSQWITGDGVRKIEWANGTNSVWLLTAYGNYEVYKESIGQYTGLKDNQGSKIYEGDILMRYDGTKRVIGFAHGSFIYTNIPELNQIHNTFSMFCTDFENCISEEWEIIGNIYENKEQYIID